MLVMRAAWVIVIFLGGFAAAAEPSLPADPRGAFPSEARRTRLEEEIAGAEPGHPWAGAYYEGDGLGMNNSLLISPSGEYSFEDSNCRGPSDWDQGAIRYQDGLLRFEGARSFALAGRDFRVVPWGARVYLINEAALVSFANDVNLGSEPRYRVHGFHLMRRGGEDLLAIGMPEVPKEIRPYLLEHAIDAAITSLGASTKSTEPYSSKEFTTEVVLDAGGREGVLPGMELWLRGELSGQAKITTVREGTSTALLSSWIPPSIGWQLSTRWDHMRVISPASLPYRITVTTSAKIFPPAEEEPDRLVEDDTFNGAEENGFTVTEVASIEYSAVSSALMHHKVFSDAIADLSMQMGANAYRVPFRSSRDFDPGPWSKVQGVVAYRIEFEGRLVRPSDFDTGFDSTDKYRQDWPKTRAKIRLHASQYHKQLERVREEVHCRLLLLSHSQCVGWAKLKVEDLSPDQLQAFRDRRGLRAKRGLVEKVLPLPDEKWWDAQNDAVEVRMRKARAEAPAAYSEYKRLEAILYPGQP